MRFRTFMHCSASFAALAAWAAPAMAQDTGTPTANTPAATPADAAAATPAADDPGDASVVVTGLRRSLQSQQNIRRNSDQIIDAIVAEDIGKLPDITVSETAARIPGVQVTRRSGEADSVLIRGLPDFSTTYNGREIFTAETRVVALQDFPAANIAALEVFKTSTADLVEPGLAGQVNVRSRRPFDFDGFEIGGTLYALYPRQSGHTSPNGNLLITDRWQTGIGEIGALVNFSYSELQYLDSEVSNTDFIANGPAGTRLPDIQRIFYRSGNRVRPSINGTLQWRPTPGLEFYIEGLWQGFRNRVSDRQISVPLWGGSQYTNLVNRPGTDLLQSGTVTNPFRPDGFQGGTYNKTDTYQFAIGGSWDSGPLRITADVAHTDSTFTGSTESIDFRFANPQTVNFNNGLPNGHGGGPEFSFQNFDPANPANYLFQGFYEEQQQATGSDWQARLDAQYETGIDFLPKLAIGVRYTDRDAHREFGNRYAGYDNQAIPISAVPLDYELFHTGFRGTGIQQDFRGWLAPTYSSIRDMREALRAYVLGLPPADGRSFGVFTTDAPGLDPTQIFDANEKTTAGYAQAYFQIGEVADGVVGLRAVHTETNITGTSNVAGVLTPVDVGNSYTDWLPNASVRFHITPQLQARLSATQTRTRPTFQQLNPSSSVGPPIGNCTPGGDPFACARTGGGGNPFLTPFTSNNYDASLEYYFSRTGFVAGSIFRRDLRGFIQNQELRYTDPVLGPLILNGPVNTNKGRIDGAELQVSTFFDGEWLPNWARGFGVQANVTYLDAHVQDPISADIQERRIYGVSKWTYNLVAMYERGGLSARLSYNKRGETLETIQNRGNDIYIETSHPAGRLDLSTNYAVTDHFTIFFDWTNMLAQPFRQDLSSARDGAARSEYTRFLRYEETIFSGGVRFRF